VLFTISFTVTATVTAWPIGTGVAVPKLTDIGDPCAEADEMSENRTNIATRTYNVLLNSHAAYEELVV
jgi:hypothetical protein